MPYDPNGAGIPDPSGKTVDQIARAITRITGLPTHSTPPGEVKQAPHEQRRAQYESRQSAVRSDSSAFMQVLPRAQDSQEQPIPDHEMPDKEPEGELWGAKAMDIHLKNVSGKGKVETRVMKNHISEAVGNIHEYRSLAGLTPLFEGESGEVPTSGVHSDNAVNGGLPGLQGKALQNVAPQHQVADDDEVGDDEYTTFDDAIAMLKKEGIDVDHIWGEFLEQRGLTVELFNALIDEALESEDADEMDAILAVENIFMQALPQLLPEGLDEGIMDKIFGRKKDTGAMAKPVAMARRAAPRPSLADKVNVSDRLASVMPPKAAPKQASTDSVQHALNHPDTTSMVTRRMRQSKPTQQIPRSQLPASPVSRKAQGESSELGSVMAKYGLQESRNFIAKATKNKGALHKKLGVPMGKKIPAKKLNKAAKAGGKMGKEANLAKTLKKLAKK